MCVVSIHPLVQKSGLKEYFFHRTLLTLGVSLISIFIPIYLVKQGYSLNQILVFYGVNSLFSIIGIYLAIKISHHTNPNNLLFSSPIAYILLISAFESNLSYLWLLVVSAISGVFFEMYWVIYNLDLFESLKSGKEGKELSVLDLLQQTASSIAPYLGGIVIIILGYAKLFYIAIFLMLGSVIPTLFLKPKKDGWKIKFRVSDFKKYSKILPAMLIPPTAVLTSAMILWPIFVQGITQSESSTGLVITTTSVATLLTTLFIRKRIDSKNKALLAISSLFYGSIWLIRAVPHQFIQILVLSALIGIFGKAFLLNSFSAVLKFAKKQNVFDFVIFREFSVNFGKIVVFFGLALLPLQQKIEFSFIITGLLVLAMGVYTLEKF